MTRPATVEPVWAADEHRTRGWYGVVLAVATEATLFATVVGSYFYIRFKTPAWPPDGIPKPEVLVPCVLTGVLVASSVPMVLASRRILVRTSLLAAAVLVVVPLVLWWLRLAHDWSSYPASRDAYASLFYTTVGVFLVHAIVGFLLVCFVLYQQLRAHYSPIREAAVHVAALWVHFVNVLAVVTLLCVYLSPHL